MDTNFVKISDYIIYEDEFHADKSKMYEGIFAQGNGYLHVRGSFEEGLTDAKQDEIYVRTMKSVTTEVQRHPLSKQGTYLPLIMGKHPFLEEVIINLPFFMGIIPYADNEKLDMAHSKISQYSRKLNMKTGVLSRQLVWDTESGCRIRILFERFASMKKNHLFVQRFTCEVISGNPHIEIRSCIDAGITTNGHNHFKNIELYSNDEILSCKVETDLNDKVVINTSNLWSGKQPQIDKIQEDKKCFQKYSAKLCQNESISLSKCSTIGCSKDHSIDYEKEVRECLMDSKKYTYEELLQESKEVLGNKWDVADVKLKGNEDLQNNLRFSIYHLLRCNTGIESRIQVCAKGFAGEAYYGRYFWDSEIYLLPFYLYTNPRAAKSLVLYRYHTLQGAKKNAHRYHCKGAKYPWQSALTGEEQCSLWEYADNEIHITADVAFGIMHYYLATKDNEFMCEYGLEILLETAKYWVSRIDYDTQGNCHLLNVMGPDEYSPMTQDNGFTNRMVKFNLTSALEMLEVVKKINVGKCENILMKTCITKNELLAFREISEKLPIPYDSNRNLFLQSADFEQYALINLEDYWKDKNKAFGHYVSQEKIYRTRCIKQADTIALMSIFYNEFTNAQVFAAYDYYKPMTTHDSSLSPAVHTLVANRIDREEDVVDFLYRTMGVDLSTEKKGAEDGIHIANCGALWQMVVHGFMGLQPGYLEDNLKVVPKLPSFIEEIETKIAWKGKLIKINVTNNKTRMEEVEKREDFL